MLRFGTVFRVSSIDSLPTTLSLVALLLLIFLLALKSSSSLGEVIGKSSLSACVYFLVAIYCITLLLPPELAVPGGFYYSPRGLSRTTILGAIK